MFVSLLVVVEVVVFEAVVLVVVEVAVVENNVFQRFFTQCVEI